MLFEIYILKSSEVQMGLFLLKQLTKWQTCVPLNVVFYYWVESEDTQWWLMFQLEPI
jgi:hypothetical protein